jgi:hypothetical protein
MLHLLLLLLLLLVVVVVYGCCRCIVVALNAITNIAVYCVTGIVAVNCARKYYRIELLLYLNFVNGLISYSILFMCPVTFLCAYLLSNWPLVCYVCS